VVRLDKLLNNIKVKKITGEKNKVKIKHLSDNSKLVKNQSLFVAINGIKVNAIEFANEAIENGAVALVVEKPIKTIKPVVQIVVEDARLTFSLIARNFYSSVVKDLKIISIVGTNGKTTTSHIIKNILQKSKIKVGVIGTNGIFINNNKIHSNLTTPDTLHLYKILEKMHKQNVQIVVMEVSAHAIKLKKTVGLKSSVAVFTNFSSEHLDFFNSIEEYKNTKMSYFTNDFCNMAVINADDEVGQQILSKNKVKCLTYGIQNPSDVFCINLKMNLKGSNFVLNLNDSVNNINLNLPAKFNIYNALAAASACFVVGLDADSIVKGLNSFHKVDGRFNTINVGKNNIVIDYAHTPKAMLNIINTVKKLSKNKIICVFGCPGSRDQFKRSQTGKIAGELCDYVIVTTDNPDIENPLKIFDQIESGLKLTSCNYEIIEDRKLAIMRAFQIKKSMKNANILVLGKGCEQYQIINNINSPYNDEQEVYKLTKNNN
jgi:UDP-N-acetylmuramoyl-L-alanyl-D-glutamate--2,6-diaminopimelate ligase